MIDPDRFKRACLAARNAIEHSDRWRRHLQSGEAGSQVPLDTSRACRMYWEGVASETLDWCVEVGDIGLVPGRRYEWEKLKEENSHLFDAATEFVRAGRAASKSFFLAWRLATSKASNSTPDWPLLERFRTALDALQLAAGLSSGGYNRKSCSEG